jgi:hypothetical protein
MRRVLQRVAQSGGFLICVDGDGLMLDAVLQGIVGLLNGAAGVTALVSTRVYFQQAPQEAALPYIIIDHVAGGDENITPRQSMDVMVQAKGVATTALAALQIGTAIRAALHLQHASMDMGATWRPIDVQHESIISFTEQVEQRQYFHSGGTFRVRAAE